MHKTEFIGIKLNINRKGKAGERGEAQWSREVGNRRGKQGRVGWFKSQRGVRRRTHLPEPDLRSYQISFNWTECHLQIGGVLAGH